MTAPSVPTLIPVIPRAVPHTRASPARQRHFWHPAWPIAPAVTTAGRHIPTGVATADHPQPPLSESSLARSPSRTHHLSCQRQCRIPSVDSGLGSPRETLRAQSEGVERSGGREYALLGTYFPKSASGVANVKYYFRTRDPSVFTNFAAQVSTDTAARCTSLTPRDADCRYSELWICQWQVEWVVGLYLVGQESVISILRIRCPASTLVSCCTHPWPRGG